MKRVWFFFSIAFLLIVGGLLFTQSIDQQSQNQEKKIQVVASFYPLAYFSEQILGGLGSVTTLTPPGSDAHSFSPTPSDAVALQKADIFFYNGAGFDEHIQEFVESIQSDSAKLIDVSQFVELLKSDHEHEGDFDPHYWQSPKNAEKMVQALLQQLLPLAQQDEDQAQMQENANLFLAKLEALDESYSMTLSQCERSTIIVAHDAFGYVANDYGFDIISISGLSPQDKPSAKRLGEIAQLAKQNDIQYIFFETLSSPELSETLASEVGAKTLVLNPIEGLTVDQIEQGETYLSIMEQNLENLKTGLACSQ